MNLWQTFLEALESLAANKLRSGLTILGIVIGVAAVIAILSIGRGAQNAITGSIQSIGTNLVFIFSGGRRDVRNPQPLTLGDAAALGDQFQAVSVQAVAPVLYGTATVTNSGLSTFTTLSGITPAYQDARNEGLLEGELINDTHLLGHSSVALIGTDVADKLFGRTQDLVGETIRIENQPFRVIGILAPRGGTAAANEDNRILIPLTTAQLRLLHRSIRDRVDLILVQATSSRAVPDAAVEVAQILRARHRIKTGENDFTVLTQQDFLAAAGTITNILTIFLGGIAAISLLVGGIGIMNIMLVSVTERTREIGLRKALGAKKRDILFQFLVESSVLSLIGGVIGIGLGWVIGFVVGRVAAANNAPIVPELGLDVVLITTLFSTAVGLFFGIYPASRAASLTPVEALRYE